MHCSNQSPLVNCGVSASRNQRLRAEEMAADARHHAVTRRDWDEMK